MKILGILKNYFGCIDLIYFFLFDREYLIIVLVIYYFDIVFWSVINSINLCNFFRLLGGFIFYLEC